MSEETHKYNGESLSEVELKSIEKHKYFLSKEAGRDVGMAYAIAHWLVYHSARWRHEQLKKELKEQWQEIEKHKWIESEKAGKDLGDTAAMDWIRKHAEEWRKWRRKQ